MDTHTGSTQTLSMLILFNSVICDNVGWKEYIKENIQEFHDLPLSWEPESKVPDWLSGTYVRNGPARLGFGSERRVLTSWLDGYAKLHSFKFSGKTVLFSGKMLESSNYLASVEAGELVPQSTLNKFNTDEEEWTFMEKLKISFKVVMGTAFDNNNPMIWRLGEKDADRGVYVATTDSPVPLRFNISDLSTLGVLDPYAYPISLSGCAHFMRELNTDNSISFMRKKLLTGKPYVEVQRYRPDSKYEEPEVVTTIVPRKHSNIHSFSLTEDLAVFFFYPVVIDPQKYYSANFHLFELIEWLEGEDTDVYIVDLKTGNLTHLHTDPTYSVHHVNAYQLSQTEIVVDLCPTPFSNMRDYLKLENMLNPPPEAEWRSTNLDSEFTRYLINTATGEVSHSYLPNPTNSRWVNQFDFPVINERYRGRAYCVVYGVTAFDYSRTALVKKNVCEPSLDKVWYRENHYSSEMWFIEHPESTGAEEDRGVLLSLVFDGEREQSYLLLLDARTFTTVARAYLPHNIPWSAHGMFFPEATLDRLNGVLLQETPVHKDEL